MSNGVPPSAPAPLRSGANAKVAFGSTNRRMSHMQAVRSMWHRGLVTHSTGPPLDRGGSDSGADLLHGTTDRVGGALAAGRAEVVTPWLQAEGAFQRAEPLHGRFQDVWAEPAAACQSGELGGRLQDHRVAALG